MIRIHWLRNTLRNKVRSSLVAKTWRSMLGQQRPATIGFVAATRLTEAAFWESAPLALGLKPFLTDPSITISVRFENKEGLPKVYNHALRDSSADILVFLHDDIWLEDAHFIDKIRASLQRFDVVGVAGNTRISKQQPAWLFRAIENNQFIWDHGYLSGSVRHGEPGRSEPSFYGPTPAACELLDGLLLAAKRRTLMSSHLLFDERFKFHFYDMDFCRSARRAGLSLGSWPMDLLHMSGGAFGSPGWQAGYAQYLSKWKN